MQTICDNKVGVNVENITDEMLENMSNFELMSVKNELTQMVIRKELIKEIKHLQGIVHFGNYRYPDYYEPNMRVDAQDRFILECSSHESVVAKV